MLRQSTSICFFFKSYRKLLSFLYSGLTFFLLQKLTTFFRGHCSASIIVCTFTAFFAARWFHFLVAMRDPGFLTAPVFKGLSMAVLYPTKQRSSFSSLKRTKSSNCTLPQSLTRENCKVRQCVVQPPSATSLCLVPDSTFS